MIKKPNVFIVCTGVGHINRGYESFTKECFAALKENGSFNLYMLKGAGKSINNEIKINCIKRTSAPASFISRILKKGTYWVEEATFLIGMLPSLIRYKPAVIYYSDFILGTFLWHLRRFFKFKYKLLFSNGAPNGPPFTTMDHVQQLLSIYEKDAISKGTPPAMQTLLPYGFNINSLPVILSDQEKDLTRKMLDLPTDKKIIISVGAINSDHKRMDYVVNEFATLDANKYFLILLGQIDENSNSVLNLASKLLQHNSYIIKQVSAADVSTYLSISDYFILASLKEGFGRVLIEAQQFGLLPIVHDYDVTKEVLKSFAVYGDLTKPHLLQELIKQVDSAGLSKKEIWSYAFDNYSWQKLNNQYIKLITKNIA